MRSRYYYGKRSGGKTGGARRRLAVILAAAVLSLAFYLYIYEKRVLPAVVEISSLRAETLINGVIQDRFKSAADRLGVVSESFYTKSVDGKGNINSLSVNTLLVNDICSLLASDISKELSNPGKQRIALPSGMFTGIKPLYNSGPDFTVRVYPVGSASVDYESSFSSAGINQINFQIWLNVSATVMVVNPLQSRQTTVTRKVLLVNTVFAGEVPFMYLNSE